MTENPRGELVLRTLAMPADTNANGDIFGGWTLSQMDLGGGILAKQIGEKPTSTVAIESMTFFKPIAVGDVVTCYAHCLKTGRSSMTLYLEIWTTKTSGTAIHHCVADGTFIYVALDEQGNSCPLPEAKQNLFPPLLE